MPVSPRLFRAILLASLVLGIAGALLDMLIPSLLPQVFSNAHAKLEAETFDDYGITGVVLLIVACVGLLALAIAGFVGLFLFKPWGRRLSVLSTLIGLPMSILLGPLSQSGWSLFLVEVSTILWGGALAIAYFAPLSVRFGSPAAATQSPLEPPAASSRSTLGTIALIIGSGVAGILIFAAAGAGFFYYKILDWSTSETGTRFPPEHGISIPPPIVDAERFFGSHGITEGDFKSVRREVLDPGPGQLIGKVTVAGKPVEGLRLRLALNGSVYSQWATSDAEGRYVVKLPYAEYRIDGYSLDSSSANTVLRGKTNNPGNGYTSGRMTVGEGRPGRGIDLDFVDPVRKMGPFGEVSLAKPVVISWEAYPGALNYRVQLVEYARPRAYETQRRVFEWDQQPLVAVTSIDLAEHGVQLKKDHYYTVEIDALGDLRRKLSESGTDHGRPDFQAVD